MLAVCVSGVKGHLFAWLQCVCLLLKAICLRACSVLCLPLKPSVCVVAVCVSAVKGHLFACLQCVVSAVKGRLFAWLQCVVSAVKRPSVCVLAVCCVCR